MNALHYHAIGTVLSVWRRRDASRGASRQPISARSLIDETRADAHAATRILR